MAARDHSSETKPAAAGRLRILPTELGCKGLLLLGALELAFLATAYSNLFFLLIVFSCVLGGLGAVWGVRELRGVRVEVAEPPPGPAGQPRPLRLELHAPGRRPFDVAVELRLGKRTCEVAHVDMVDGRATVQGTLPELPRGLAATAAVQVVTRQPFGFFSVRRRWPLAMTIVTHPAPTPADVAAVRSGDAGAHAGAGRASGASFRGLRAFRDGDAPNTVHWAATARRGTPIVKEREPEAGAVRVLRLDRRLPAAAFEQALAQATAAVLDVRSSGRPVRILAQELDLVVRDDRSSERAALHWLAGATALPSDAPAPPQRADAVPLPIARAAIPATATPSAHTPTASAQAEATP